MMMNHQGLHILGKGRVLHHLVEMLSLSLQNWVFMVLITANAVIQEHILLTKSIPLSFCEA